MKTLRRRSWHPFLALGAALVLALAVAGWRVGWSRLWLTPDQHGRILMREGKPADAAAAFVAPVWRGVAQFRAGDFKAAAASFGRVDSAESAYDEANALVMLGKYEDATKRYERALELRRDWPDAIANRHIAAIRAQRMKAEGGVTDDTESAPDEVVYDKTKKGGTDTTAAGDAVPMSDEAVRAMWLKRVETRPADFLKARFAYQLGAEPGASP